jgi:glycosyltransferase involved in cell wall biosynthesis
MNLISVVIPTFEEEQNIESLIIEVEKQFIDQNYDYEIIIIDNHSKDNTVKIVKDLINKNKKIKLIVNNQNYGPLKSPYYGLLQTKGDAAIYINADFQDPPELIKKLIKKWNSGNEVVLLQKSDSDENKIMFFLRKLFYRTLNSISENRLTIDTTGSGIFDKKIINQLRKIEDPNPYLRGIVKEIAEIEVLPFTQPKRKYGKSKVNIFVLYDVGMLGLVKHSKIILRAATFFGLVLSFFSILAALVFFILKLLYWDSYSIGIAPMLIGIFFVGGFILFFLGLIGEYILVIMSHIRNMPLVIEKERINFDN